MFTLARLLKLGFIIGFSCVTLAQVTKTERRFSLNWEKIEGAKFYDIEIYAKTNIKPKLIKNVKVVQADWSGTLQFGKYTLRIRARDKRNVPGDWSETRDFEVNLESPTLSQPKSAEEIHTKSDDTASVKLVWAPVGGAKEYEIRIVSSDETIKMEQKVTETSLSLNLPVAKSYNWTVAGVGENGLRSEVVGSSTFNHWGRRINSPVLNRPENDFVRELSWEKTEHADNYELSIERFEQSDKKWKPVKTISTQAEKVEIPLNWPGGKYHLRAKALSNLRESSNPSDLVFMLRSGDRSPASEEVAVIRESIDRTDRWFAVASWLLTNYTYSGINSDQTPGNQVGLKFSGALGGTGRVGLGYMVPEKPWGFLGVIDYSGMVINNNTSHFGSMEFSGIRRDSPSERYEIRHQVGGFYKEVPVIIANSSTDSSTLQGAAIGPHYGIEVWRASNSKLGFQLNAHAYLNLLTVRSPNGNASKPDLSYQFGFLGSYRLTRKITGLAGYAYRRDSFSYKANDGSTNSATLTGNYLNLFLEWPL